MQADSCKYEFVLDNLFFANIDGPEVQKGKVNVVLVVKKTSRAFELNFQTDGMVWVPCDRCLDDMEQPVSSTDKLLVKFGHEYAEEGDNLIVIPEEEGEINVAWFMYEFIALAIPMKHVHAPGTPCAVRLCGIPIISRSRTPSSTASRPCGNADRLRCAAATLFPRNSAGRCRGSRWRTVLRKANISCCVPARCISKMCG